MYHFENIMGDTIVTAQYEKEESIKLPPTEPEQPQAPGQGGEMNNTEIKHKQAPIWKQPKQGMILL